jgi:CBS domain-containing protein
VNVMRVGQLLEDNEERCRIRTIPADADLETAIGEMARAGVSALIAMAGDLPVGILAERDVLRCHLRNRDRKFEDIPVREAMTDRLIVANAEDPASDAMAVMIQADIRHLPVIRDRRLAGMLTLGDLVRRQVGALTAEIHYLQEYISDLQEAGLD